MTTRKPFYELFTRASEATCFNCYGTLDNICLSGFGPGNGDVQGDCNACRMVTFFDVAEERADA